MPMAEREPKLLRNVEKSDHKNDVEQVKTIIEVQVEKYLEEEEEWLY